MARIVEGCLWALVCVLVWLATASSVTAQEMLVAVPAGLACGAAAVAGRIAEGGRWPVRARWLHDLARLPVAVVVGTATVLAATLRPHARRGRTQTRTSVDQRADEATSRLAVRSLIFAAVPTGYVVDTDPDSGTVTVHELADTVPGRARIGLTQE